MKLNIKRISYHIAFWVAEVLFFTFLFSVSNGTYAKTFLTTLSLLPFEIFLVYFTLYFLIPRYLLANKILKFVLLSVLVGIVAIVLLRFYTIFFIYPFFASEESYLEVQKLLSENFVKYFFLRYSFFDLFVEVYIIVGFASSIKLFKFWLKNQNDKHELEKQNIKSELAMLQTQINPHFLFNTLNNIDALIYQNQEKASDSIIKLSEIMRFMLYETNGEKVLLEKEIDYLKSYISLLKLRVTNQDFINFEIIGNCSGKMIAPLLLVPFIENAFKHGEKKTVDAKIDIRIEVKNNLFIFRVSNKKKKTVVDNKEQGGIGLKNVQRRLKLIYKDKADLKIDESENSFNVGLKIEL